MENGAFARMGREMAISECSGNKRVLTPLSMSDGIARPQKGRFPAFIDLSPYLPVTGASPIVDFPLPSPRFPISVLHCPEAFKIGAIFGRAAEVAPGCGFWASRERGVRLKSGLQML